MKPKEVLSKAAELTDTLGGQSLGRWMTRHHDVLAREFDAATPAKPDWNAFVLALAQGGLVDKKGCAIKASTAARTWNRVRAAVHKARSQRKALSAHPPPRLIPALAHEAPASPPFLPTVATAQETTQDAAEKQDAAGIIAKLRKEMDKRSGRN